MSNKVLYSNEVIAHNLALEYLRNESYSSKDEYFDKFSETYAFFLKKLSEPKQSKKYGSKNNDDWMY